MILFLLLALPQLWLGYSNLDQVVICFWFAPTLNHGLSWGQLQSSKSDMSRYFTKSLIWVSRLYKLYILELCPPPSSVPCYKSIKSTQSGAIPISKGSVTWSRLTQGFYLTFRHFLTGFTNFHWSLVMQVIISPLVTNGSVNMQMGLSLAMLRWNFTSL